MGDAMIRLSKKDNKGWQTLHVRVEVWRKLRLLAADRDTTLGELIAQLVEKEGQVLEQKPSE